MPGFVTDTVRKPVALALAGATIAASFALSAAPAEARGRHGGWRGPAIAAGVIGGLVAGSFAAQAARPYYRGPVYYRHDPFLAPACYRQRRPLFDHWGNVVGYRIVRICR